MTVLILTTVSFPKGMAQTNRLLSYATGMVELGHSVHVICMSPSERPSAAPVNTEVRGSYNGVSFEYAPGTTLTPASAPGRKLCTLKGLLRALILLWRSARTEKIDALFVPHEHPIFAVAAYGFSRVLGIPLLHERSEHPAVVTRKSLRGRLNLFIYLHLTCKLFDGMVLMTNFLLEYFEPRVRKRTKLIVVPMTVEPGRFAACQDTPGEPSRYIAYCGNMGNTKDGISILIDAFGMISEKHRDVKLYLIGGTNDSREFDKLVQQAEELNLSDRVVFTGSVTRDQMPAYLCNASVLALARPRSLQAQGGFPTKLGEYLATGNPVVVTRVGEIPDYLIDGRHAFLAEPDSAGAFAERLDYALSNPEEARTVGVTGRELARTVFNYKVQSRRMIEFIEGLG